MLHSINCMYGVKLFVAIYIVRSVQGNETASIEYVQKFTGSRWRNNPNCKVFSSLHCYPCVCWLIAFSFAQSSVALSWSTAGEIIISYPLSFLRGNRGVSARPQTPFSGLPPAFISGACDVLVCGKLSYALKNQSRKSLFTFFKKINNCMWKWRAAAVALSSTWCSSQTCSYS